MNKIFFLLQNDSFAHKPDGLLDIDLFNGIFGTLKYKHWRCRHYDRS